VQADSAIEQNERMKTLREALTRHGTMSLVENGSYYLGMKHAQDKQTAVLQDSSQSSVPQTPPQLGAVAKSWVSQAALKDVASVVGHLQSVLPGMGRMPTLRGLATAMKAGKPS